ncbi:phage tail protein I [Acinetobacter baumannii]|uniref:phage tail protein I n=1 Tax=Acinetobacter baumannii TaxID=470 RepID=UPI0019002257|nr:phage tail protein I [Acinetobacter baumannii]MBJ9442946.1 phage tail protein I [Acinetobacter baumannii]
MPSLLPPNTTKFEINFDSAFSRVSEIDISTRQFNDPMKAPFSVLPWLAWEKSVDIWNKNWSENQKRQTIQNAYKVHSSKGTIGSLESALSSLGYQIKIQEWFSSSPALKPYSFNLFIEISQERLRSTDLKDIFEVVKTSKNLRSKLLTTSLSIRSDSEIYLAAALTAGHETQFSRAPGGLYLDGTWALDGTKKLNGVDF